MKRDKIIKAWINEIVQKCDIDQDQHYEILIDLINYNYVKRGDSQLQIYSKLLGIDTKKYIVKETENICRYQATIILTIFFICVMALVSICGIVEDYISIVVCFDAFCILIWLLIFIWEYSENHKACAKEGIIHP